MGLDDEPQYGGLIDGHTVLTIIIVVVVFALVVYGFDYLSQHIVCKLPEHTDASRIIFVWEGCP